MCMTEFCGSSDYCNKCVNNPNGDKRKMIEEELKHDAEKSLDKRLGTYAYIRKQDCYTNYVDGYIDGAEPREKRIEELIALINAERERQEKCDDVHLRTIAELEKENKALRQEWEIMKNTIADYNDFCDKYMKLEKENKELKNERNAFKMYSDGAELDAINLNEQLTKAKEIIEKVAKMYRYSPRVDEIIEQAEQFLKEE